MTEHDCRFVLLSAEQLIIFCVESVEEIFYVVERIRLYTEWLQSDIVFKLDSILFFVFVSHLLEFLLSKV